MKILKQVFGRMKENILHPFNYDRFLMELKEELLRNKEKLAFAMKKSQK
jgi:hypothetical protein